MVAGAGEVTLGNVIGFTMFRGVIGALLAVVAAVTKDPDVVLMDLRMPDMDDVEATLAVRDRCPDVAFWC